MLGFCLLETEHYGILLVFCLIETEHYGFLPYRNQALGGNARFLPYRNRALGGLCSVSALKKLTDHYDHFVVEFKLFIGDPQIFDGDLLNFH